MTRRAGVSGGFSRRYGGCKWCISDFNKKVMRIKYGVSMDLKGEMWYYCESNLQKVSA